MGRGKARTLNPCSDGQPLLGSGTARPPNDFGPRPPRRVCTCAALNQAERLSNRKSGFDQRFAPGYHLRGSGHPRRAGYGTHESG